MSRTRKPTRTNLYKLEEQIELAERGHDILERKRDGLILEFMDVLDEYERASDDLVAAYARAQDRESLVRAMAGDVALEGIARARRDHPELTVTQRNVMGVVLSQFEAHRVSTPLDEHGYGLLGTSPVVDEVVDAYEDLLELIVRVAELESTVKRLLAEIQRTMRRVNALEHAVIPDLRADRKRIQRHLAEQERQAIILRKWIKTKKHESITDNERARAREAATETTAQTDSTTSPPQSRAEQTD